MGRQGDSSEFAAKLEFNLLGDAVEVAEAAHEGVPQAAVVGAIFHLFGEDVAGVDLVGDVEDVDSAILNPFAGAVFTDFQMADVLRGNSICPDDSGCVVIVDKGRFGVIEEWSSSHIETIREVADTDSNLGTFAGDKDSGFTRAQRYLFLAHGFPRYRTPHMV